MKRDINIDDYLKYMIRIRRRLHRRPELGFDLPQTVEAVKHELDEIGVDYTLKYGKSSIVASVGLGEKIIAVRADMDALPVEEKTGLSFASENKGKMHACGHDAHTAILLGLARFLKENEDILPCKVRLIFQPAEECSESGAKMLVENGVMDGVDHIICTHCENTLDTGTIGVCEGDYMAACASITVRFKGMTSHATIPEQGIDAIAMANEAYIKLKDAIAKEAGDLKYIWSVGRFQGGDTHNVIADDCLLDVSFRYYDTAFADKVKNITYEICEGIAQAYGGSFEIDWNVSSGAVCNDECVVRKFKSAVDDVATLEPKMSSEDFAWYLTKAPGMIFRFGSRNESKGCIAPIHRNDFTLDENAMIYALEAFIKYIYAQAN